MFTENGIRDSAHLALDLPVYLTVYLALAWLLLRMGLVPAILTLFSIILFGRIPAVAEFNSWYLPVAVAEILTLGPAALYGFWRSQSKAEVSPPR